MHVQPGLGGPSGGVRLVYAIFEGGGAKGITHIGALKALERENLAVAGAAGSSAGAIIAALVAVGYTADELFAEDGSRHILSDRQKTPVDLLGRIAWQRFRLLRLIAGIVVLPVLILIIGAHWPLGGFLVPGLAAIWILLAWARGHRKRSAAALLGLVLLASAWWAATAFLSQEQIWRSALLASGVATAVLIFLAWPLFSRWGLFTSQNMRVLLNDVIREKLKQHYVANGRDPKKVPEQVRFRHIDPAAVPQCIPLKIIVSEVRSGAAVVFDQFHEDYRNAVIADAVAASSAIPFVFESPKVEGAPSDGAPIFVDGGLVSNLPAWSFRKEKRALEREVGGPPVPIVAFTLNEGIAQRVAKPSLGAFVRSVMSTGIFGSQKVVQEFVGDLVVVPLPSPLGTLDFACTRAEAVEAYRAGQTKAGETLAKQRLVAGLTAGALNHVLDSIRPMIVANRTAANLPMPRLRLNVVDPVDDVHTAFRVAAAIGMEGDPDDRLELDARNDVAPRAFRNRTPLIALLKGRPAADLVMTKYEHALVAKDVESVICIPVASRAGGVPERVLCLDSSDSLQAEFADTSFMNHLQRVAEVTLRSKIEDAAASAVARARES